MGDGYATEVRNIYRSFKLRSRAVEKQLGEGLSNPGLFGQLLVDSQMANIASFNRTLTPIIL
ncbi:hypothetical protein B1F79_01360 [Coxiella-like endosymbiont of Rhipicephalus sanguineus]|nr:hypothetical protein [Coxiella-like endosymbiont of Rhipicephalus sanguineus]